MIRLVLLIVALCGLIYVRATSADYVPIWSGWWWVWIIATCVIAGCAGWVARELHDQHH